jgi:hypothetical protein
VPRSNDYNVGTELIMYVVGTCTKMRFVRLNYFWALLKVQNEAIPRVPPKRQTEEWKALKRSAKAASAPKCARCSLESTWNSGGEMGDGAGK